MVQVRRSAVITHGNAIAGLPPESQFACGSNASRVADMADEIVCFSLDPNRYADGSLDVRNLMIMPSAFRPIRPTLTFQTCLRARPAFHSLQPRCFALPDGRQ